MVAVSRVVSAESIRFTPPARASVASPFRRLWQAMCTATSDDEHSVSTATLGPWRPSTYDSRPAAKAWPLPVSMYTSSASRPAALQRPR